MEQIQPLIDAFLGLNRRQQMIVVAAIALLLVGLAIFYYQNQQRLTHQAAESPQMLLGNPSNATANLFDRTNYLMPKPWYCLSYNDSTGTPNWVSWQVVADDLGTAPRKPDFDTDESLPSTFYHVTTRDYSGSGFDRGHMCPHSDRAATEEMSFSTFIMTNIIPQAPNVNRKASAQLEEYCRKLVTREHDHLYIIAGPAGRGGHGSKGPAESLGAGHVTVPASCWKVVVVVPESAGGNDLAAIGPSTRVITVLMPNDERQVSDEWTPFRTSPAEVERQTSLHFFDRLSPPVAQALRQKVDDAYVPPPEPMHFRSD